MTNEQAEIQKAAREEFRRQLVTYMPDLKPHELEKLLDDAQVSIGDWAKWHISQSEEERKRIQELEAWKESAIAVMPPYQEIGRELDVRLGDSVHDKILPGIQALSAEVSRLRGALQHIRDKAANPMESYDAGLVIDANSVLDEADEALAQPTGKEGD